MTSSTSSISGLASGMDTATIVSQLMQIEAQPQTLLKTKLTQTQSQAAAYRQINTVMASLSSAAQALTGTALTSARKAASTSSSVAATAGTTAVAGSSISFTVNQLAAAQTSISAGTWSSATGDVRTASTGTTALPTWPLTFTKADGTTGTINVAPGGSLNDAVAAINSSNLGLSASVIQLDSAHFKLQVTSNTTGKNGAFELLAPGETGDSTFGSPGAAFSNTTTAADATITLTSGDTATSSTNTFNELLTGVSVTVSQVSTAPAGSAPATPPTPTTISVSSDTGGVTSKVKALIDAANSALTTISKYTDANNGTDAVLKGDWSVTSLANQILDQISGAVGGDPTAPAGTAARIGKSPAQVGISLDRYGAIVFDSAKFSSALSSDPTLAQTIVGGVTGNGADGVANTPDDSIDTDGIAARLSVLAERASDKTTGMLTSLANSQDAQVKDIQSQIDDWTLRLQQRQSTLTSQFTAMETALGNLKNQSSWLTSQINSLPTWSSTSTGG
jgi:flagellar hook-associated protein 2